MRPTSTEYVVHDSPSLTTAHWSKSFTDRHLAAIYAQSARGFADTVTITRKVNR